MQRWYIELRQVLRWLSIIAVFMLMLPYIDPERKLVGHIPPCEMKVKYHKPCIACGSTRAYYATAYGKYNLAKDINPIGYYCFWLVVGYLVLVLIYEVGIYIYFYYSHK